MNFWAAASRKDIFVKVPLSFVLYCKVNFAVGTTDKSGSHDITAVVAPVHLIVNTDTLEGFAEIYKTYMTLDQLEMKKDM